DRVGRGAGAAGGRGRARRRGPADARRAGGAGSLRAGGAGTGRHLAHPCPGPGAGPGRVRRADRATGGGGMTASLRRLAPYLFVGVVALATIAGLTTRPDSPGATPAAERVIVAGAVGLRWDDVDPDRTPNLWRLAAGGSIGALSVRSANSPTCAADGWLTLGAGNWAADRAGDRLHSGDSGPPGEYCPRLDVTVETESGKALLPHQETLVRYNRDLPWGAVPGALAGAVDCTRAFGMGAAVAAARSFGRVDYYRPSLPDDP